MRRRVRSLAWCSRPIRSAARPRRERFGLAGERPALGFHFLNESPGNLARDVPSTDHIGSQGRLRRAGRTRRRLQLRARYHRGAARRSLRPQLLDRHPRRSRAWPAAGRAARPLLYAAAQRPWLQQQRSPHLRALRSRRSGIQARPQDGRDEPCRNRFISFSSKTARGSSFGRARGGGRKHSQERRRRSPTK